ncbi:MAG: class I SAM-dependent methyltransferase [Verrucomicrobia bacterium]|nr:class I SAM-dependent methyltransferase [Verrucomicrobiota bacterium]
MSLPSNAAYWDAIAERYQSETRISTDAYHYGPLLPGDGELHLLPQSVNGLRCLEVGSGAGQNSIYLAKQGARCVALDASEKQIQFGRALAETEKVEVEFIVADMDSMSPRELGTFDLIHSTYALPFSHDPAGVILNCASMLGPDGVFLLTVGHPLYSGEWLDIEDESGLFLRSYFRLSADTRHAEDSHSCKSEYWPLSTVTEWIRDAGLSVDRFSEPRPCPVSDMSEDDICERVPYDSIEWRVLYEVLREIPIVAVFKCVRRV